MGREPAVIVRVRGGLGNQLFCYAAGRALAIRNGVPLKLDVTSGYQNDKYGRTYLLDHFNITAERATPQESYEGFAGRLRRRAAVRLAKVLKPGRVPYIVEQQRGFDPRVAAICANRTVYLDGYWQDERYFLDAARVIRQELTLKIEHTSEGSALAAKMRNCNSVSIHLRSYSELTKAERDVLALDYYERALSIINERVSVPCFFCFSDAPEWARTVLSSQPGVTFVTLNHGRGDLGALEDLWLMSQCHHHIIANSSFSWWGAWLDQYPQKVVVAPYAGPGRAADWVPSDWYQE